MEPGEVIANAFAAGFVICLVAVVFLLFGKPLRAERHVRMVIFPPAHEMTTAAIKTSAPELPADFDLSKAAPRPPTNPQT